MSLEADDVRVATIGQFSATVGEGPVWLEDSNELLWIDMIPGLIHRTNLASGQTETTATGGFLGAAAPRSHGGYVIATRTGFDLIDADGTVHRGDAVVNDTYRMNDAKCDPLGRLWAGSTETGFAPGLGALYVLDATGETRKVLEGLTLPNGMGWSPGGDTYYLADSVTHDIWSFRFDAAGGSLSNRREFYHFAEADGLPDGLCVDDTGCLWVALWGGNRVVQLSPDGDRLREIILPATQTSSCAFAGADLSQLVVTSASDGLDRSYDDGALFGVSGLGVRGVSVAAFAG